MDSNNNALTHRANADGRELEAFIGGCLEEDITTYNALASVCLPRLLGVSARFLEQPSHREAVCRDTLLIARRNLSQRDRKVSASCWLYGILGSRLYNQLLALHGSLSGVMERLGSLATPYRGKLETPTGPRPALLSGAPLVSLADKVPPVPPSPALLSDLRESIEAEIAHRRAPLTPTGELVYPPLYDPALRYRMLCSRTAHVLKEGFKRHLGRPLEEWLFRRWLDGKAGGALLEQNGLPRRSVEAYLDERLDIAIDPEALECGLDFPVSFPSRSQRRRIANFFIWSGDWDQLTMNLANSQRRRFIQDLWTQRLDLTASASYAELMSRLEKGLPRRLHHQGILLDSERRILAYLSRYLLYMEDMSCFGFKSDLGKDRLGVVLDRNGNIIKINKGLHRLAMARVVGLKRVTVRVRGVHQHWWEAHKTGARGREAMENVAMSLPSPALYY
ncbi:hypothetical protein HNO52_11225 [Billgrantia diversa]|uniref:hypothetical protein n=1 Tax=Halomonas sp. MCCC 1A13316 TaxID=2733487 RepID=UPI0018A4122F|nr:hypothetical protein [Halomonas sp. MCCC 1A13316]QOR39025.1 hypothetical protein HNO52_11225 [Halomonas sp. MCCC 1A13316]